MPVDKLLDTLGLFVWTDLTFGVTNYGYVRTVSSVDTDMPVQSSKNRKRMPSGLLSRKVLTCRPCLPFPAAFNRDYARNDNRERLEIKRPLRRSHE